LMRIFLNTGFSWRRTHSISIFIIFGAVLGCAKSNLYTDGVCGDGIVTQGESCDDGNLDSGDGCDPECKIETSLTCGNWVLDFLEECDDGNIDNGDGCDSTCHFESPPNCGDGILDPNEDCDDGNIDNGDGCDSNCHNEIDINCGDGVVDPNEECDDGNIDETDDCPFNCLTAFCGDGYIQAGIEECDDGNSDWADGCGADCITEFCGDGIIQSNLGEDCDDGNIVDGDGCDSSCHHQVTFNCGDGVVDPVEECDDGNSDETDDCPFNCLTAFCGDGYIQAGHEECDDSNNNDGDGCASDCVVEYCGDGIIQSGLGEECEGGSSSCSTSCGTTGTNSCINCSWGGCVPPSETCNVIDDNCDSIIDTAGCLVTISRFGNPSTGDHMYKTNTSPDPGYVLEYTTHFKLYSMNVAGTIPIYQLSNGSDHMISIGPGEASPPYYSQGILGYAAGSSSWHAAGYAPTEMCRYYNSNTHDHMIYSYISDTSLPSVLPGYIRETCLYKVWGF
jgi:cysteine-rich repeat protein